MRKSRFEWAVQRTLAEHLVSGGMLSSRFNCRRFMVARAGVQPATFALGVVFPRHLHSDTQKRIK
jgi:hypothetical protein